MSSFGSIASHLASSTFCWLPPERLPTICRTPGVAMRSSSTKLLASASALASEKFTPRRHLGEHRRGDVVDDVHAEEEAGRLAVLRHHADAGALAVPGARRSRSACRRCGSCPPSPARAPKIALAELAAARADQPGEADDLAGAHRDRRRPHAGRRRDVLGLEHDLAGAARRRSRAQDAPRGRPSAGSARRSMVSAPAACRRACRPSAP